MSKADDGTSDHREPVSSIPFRRPGNDGAQPFHWQTVEVRGDDVEPRVRLGTKRVASGTCPTSGDVIVLDQETDEPVEIIINNRLVGRGKVVVTDGKLAIEVTQMVESSVRKAG